MTECGAAFDPSMFECYNIQELDKLKMQELG